MLKQGTEWELKKLKGKKEHTQKKKRRRNNSVAVFISSVKNLLCASVNKRTSRGRDSCKNALRLQSYPSAKNAIVCLGYALETVVAEFNYVHRRPASASSPVQTRRIINPLKPELNPICYLLALLGAHHFLHVSRIRVKLFTLR